MSKNKFDKKKNVVKRLQIAFDVIRQIQAKQIMVHTGYYCSVPEDVDYDESEDFNRWAENNHNRPARQCLSKIKNNCQVCALGSMMLSRVGLFNDAVVGDLTSDSRSSMTNALGDYFEQDQLDMIEAAFECEKSLAHVVDYDDKRLADSVSFGEMYDLAENRLEAIMTNLIEHGGTFKPHKDLQN